ncbi:hypothetical protein JG688_00014089 [Phytophthora aleatoria]|uniref:Uncharacterized protein n=1 Tax=Phytophthora aleatoria TaxID=2496075 RepID=A0A8J5ICE7_9STRA|nr:hypothetical protein JG688_00014089 [Phytophthora aleatoria]
MPRAPPRLSSSTPPRCVATEEERQRVWMRTRLETTGLRWRGTKMSPVRRHTVSASQGIPVLPREAVPALTASSALTKWWRRWKITSKRIAR